MPGRSGGKLKMTLGCGVATLMNCADNSGAKNLYIMAVRGTRGNPNWSVTVEVTVGPCVCLSLRGSSPQTSSRCDTKQQINK